MKRSPSHTTSLFLSPSFLSFSGFVWAVEMNSADGCVGEGKRGERGKGKGVVVCGWLAHKFTALSLLPTRQLPVCEGEEEENLLTCFQISPGTEAG